MSPEFRSLIEEHLRRLRRLVADHSDLISELTSREPSLIEREALGTVLHSFYTGIEFILRAVSEHTGEPITKTGSWHTELLESMSIETGKRARVIGPQTTLQLRSYLLFRHRFRNIYGSELDWTLMRPLVLRLQETLNMFDADVAQFMNRRGA